MSKTLEAYRSAIERHRRTLDQHKIEHWVGAALGSDVLKLFRPDWRNSVETNSASGGEIFFSVWVHHNEPRGRANYNIHALKLRELTGYNMQSREFAAAFRQEFSIQLDQWPNVSTDFGPQTLMQGWILLDSPRFDQQLDGLILRFVRLYGVLDRLLRERKKTQPTPRLRREKPSKSM